MSIRVSANNPSDLVTKLKELIDRKRIKTWSYDDKGYFTHTAEQWIHRAWFTPTVLTSEVVFNILGVTDVTMTKVVYAVYHGRFIETLLSHLDTQMLSCSASSLPDEEDNI